MERKTKVEEKVQDKGILGKKEEVTRKVESDSDLLEPKKMEVKKTKIEKEL